ncbi:hypothetical protein PSTT_08111 [Puccinia striiformis]|uniref:DDE Tnp4 domain-containing protein n=1 Tax=Puccinia striiformis TaxID=27350 RepID=A0A2S4VE42_9BASI|nr:hypothetical protein PSTT_08111 [Puccinia striiformis]
MNLCNKFNFENPQTLHKSHLPDHAAQVRAAESPTGCGDDAHCIPLEAEDGRSEIQGHANQPITSAHVQLLDHGNPPDEETALKQCTPHQSQRVSSESSFEELGHLPSQRHVARTPLPRVATISRTYEVLTNTTEEVFRIYDHHIFYNNSNNPQAPVEMQLLVALSHLGMYGNGGSPHVLAQYYNISPGSVENYTNRCILAIIETLEKKHVYWPNAQQRATFTATLAGRTVFDRCIGFVDGAIFPLTSAPTKHKEDYWMRKMVYAVNSLIVCNWQRRVIYAVHGWCGSAHDQRVYKNSQVSQIKQDTIIPAFKRAPGRPLPPNKQQFNYELSHNRVIVEHTIGMLKNRWQSLKSLTIELLGKKTAKRLNAWLRACVVLHNYLLDLCKAEWDELNNPVENFDPDEDEEIDSGVISGEDVARRDLLFSRFCQLL